MAAKCCQRYEVESTDSRSLLYLAYILHKHQRTALDFAHKMGSLVDEHYPRAEKIRMVLDNLNTHSTRTDSRSVLGGWFLATQVRKKLHPGYGVPR